VGDKVSETAKREEVESAEFLAAAAAVAGAEMTESGLIYTESKRGEGATPADTDSVKVHYHGTLKDGTVFDTTRDDGEPAVFPLNGVIPCWTEGLKLMKVGGQGVLTCPANLAYGDRGNRKIKGGATLRFEVELISIE
jgi:FKBP-type peptidyl-prolyl cis-trans isomerase